MAKIDNRTLVKHEYTEKIWANVSELYTQKQSEYANVWGKKRKIMIILYFFLFFPGLFYSAFVYNTRKAKTQRIEMANSIMGEAVGLVVKANKNVAKIDSFISPSVKISNMFLPTERANASLFFKKNNINFFENSFARKLIEAENTRNNIPLITLLASTKMLPELTGNKNKGGLFAQKNSSDAYRRNLKISTNVSLNVKLIDGTSINFTNLALRSDEIVRRRKTDGTISTKTNKVPLFAGNLVTLSSEPKYEHAFSIKSKKFSVKRDRNFVQDKAKLKYEMESVDFMDNFDLLVAHEDGIEIRNQFSINALGSFSKLAIEALPFTFLSNGKGSGSVFAFDNINRDPNDLPFNIEDPRKFFKKDEYAKQVLGDDFTILDSVIEAIVELKRTKFFVEEKPQQAEQVQDSFQ